MSAHLTLFAPGLCAAWRGEGAGLPVAQAPALRRLLARADRLTTLALPFEDALARLFGMPAEVLPWGALGLWGERGERPQDFVLRLDPVHLKLGMTDAIVFGGASLHLRRDESQEIARALEAHFAERGWRIDVPAAERWYLRLTEASELDCTPLSQALGRDAGLFKPQGRDARRWLADITEAQMVLFTHPVNQAREARGFPTINSVWPWGAGSLLSPFPPAQFTAIHANHPLARGLAYAQDLSVHDLAETLDECAELSGNALIVLDDLLQPLQDGDFDDWQATLEGLEARWFSPLRTALARGRIARLTLETGGAARFVCKPAHRWRVWRRERPLEQQCAASV
ncbi:MAG: hypothetical protein AB1717_06685 [Pseudomonadota bacterium]